MYFNNQHLLSDLQSGHTKYGAFKRYVRISLDEYTDDTTRTRTSNTDRTRSQQDGQGLAQLSIILKLASGAIEALLPYKDEIHTYKYLFRV